MSSVMGVTADAEGKPVGVVAVCDGYTNVAELQIWDRPAYSATNAPVASPNTDFGEWIADQPATELGTWSLVTGDPWTVQQPIALLDGYTYYLSGRGRDEQGFNDSLSLGVEFTLADVRALEPGQVRYADYRGSSASTDYAVVPLEEFRASVCR